MVSIISSFKGPYSFLSNFYECCIEYPQIVKTDEGYVSKNVCFPSAEHMYQFFKATFLNEPVIAAEIFNAKTPGETKQLAKQLVNKNFYSWLPQRIHVMTSVLSSKFKQNPELMEMLLHTAPHLLVEGNTWKDEFWGVDLNSGQGKNWLGILLMKLRNELDGSK